MAHVTWTDNTTPISADNLNQLLQVDTSTDPPKIYAGNNDVTQNVANALYNKIVGDAINASY